MINDTTTWKALAFLEECKKRLPNFHYAVHYGTDNLPDAIMYMTSEMINNLIRYGDIMHLDAQMRAFNKMCWPYIGIVLINNLKMICLCCEAIVIGETLDMYVWLIQTMATVVKQWNASKLRIIYGDGFVTKSILHQLNITNTCILHGDSWHLIHKILPRPENFGSTTFCLIKPYVEMMISSDTKAQWDLGYSQARRVIISKPRELSLLEKYMVIQNTMEATTYEHWFVI